MPSASAASSSTAMRSRLSMWSQSLYIGSARLPRTYMLLAPQESASVMRARRSLPIDARTYMGVRTLRPLMASRDSGPSADSGRG